MTEPDSEPNAEIRELLLEYSDHRAVRSVFGAYTGTGTADAVDYVEAMRATDGKLVVGADDGVADVYARWSSTAGRYEHLTIWPPWTLGGYEHATASELVAFLEEKDDLQPMCHDATPFADAEALSRLTDGNWP